MKLLKPFNYSKVKTGDTVKFHYLHSISEGKGGFYEGLVVNSKN